MHFAASTVIVGTLMVLVQLLAALPWVVVVFFNPDQVLILARAIRDGGIRALLYRPYLWILVPLAVAALGSIALAGLSSETFGKIYGAVLQIQLTIDFLILLVALMLKVWPKGGAVAQAAFREAVRQPMYWLLFTIAFVLMWIFPFVPYFTFGEDYLMVKEMGYDTIMLVAAVFGTLAASLFISDEIEGRTAVTLMSKPVSRRQFLLGKFAGIMLAILLLFGLLGCCFQAVLLYKHWFEENFAFLDPMPFPPWVTAVLGKLSLAGPAMSFLRGVGFWADHAFETLPGLVLSLFLAMMVVALAVALATRLPMVVNVCVTLAVYLLANLSPVLVSIGDKAKLQKDAGAVAQVLSFTSQLFDTLLPGLHYFQVGPAVVTDTPLPTGPFWAYVGAAALYGTMYTCILLLLGLILFEDRDLA